MDQEIGLPVGPDRIGDLRDPLDPRSRRGRLHPRRLPGHAKREVVDRIRHRSREEERLGPLAQSPYHILDLGTESHVEHPVRFVQNEKADARQPGTAPPLQIDQTPRCSDDHLVTPLESVKLWAVGHTAVDHRRPDLRAPGECTGIFAHLLCQFPGGAEHKDLKSCAGFDHLQRRQHEGPGLACTGPRDSNYISPGSNQGNRPVLNGSRRRPSQRLNGGQAEFREPEG